MQETLFDTDKLQQAFDKFDAENPQVWNAFKAVTLRVISSGFEHYGAKAIWEYIRFNFAMKTGGEFKLNNNYTAFYARKFIEKYPQFEGFFELRKRKTG